MAFPWQLDSEKTCGSSPNIINHVRPLHDLPLGGPAAEDYDRYLVLFDRVTAMTKAETAMVSSNQNHRILHPASLLKFANQNAC